MTPPSPSRLPPRDAGPEPVRRRLDEVVRRIRVLRLSAGVARVTALTALALVALYAADRLLDLPLAVRAVAGLGTLSFLGAQAWRRVVRPLVRGPDRLDAARLVESRLDLQGRLVASLQLPDGPEGSLEHAVSQQAAELARDTDLRSVLTSGPSLAEVGKAGAVLVAFAGALLLGRPYVDVFARRWSLQDVAWPRDTRLELVLPPSSSVHVLEGDTLIASRGGHVSVQVAWEGVRPARVELIVEGDEGPRTTGLTLGAGDSFMGHLSVRRGDTSLRVTGGDDDGAQTLTAIEVVEPPRLDDPLFQLEPPAYVGLPPREVGSEGLVVSEGTRVTVRGRPSGPTTAATLWFSGSGESLELELTEVEGGTAVSGSFLAGSSDTLTLNLVGVHGLTSPDPSQHALVVHEDRPPVLRVQSPARSDVKVTPNAVVPVAVLAEDDHGVASVTLALGDATGLELSADASGGGWRHVLDLAQLDLSDTVPYEIEATDRRDLPGKGRQSARALGRRIDIVDPSEVQRLLADRQLRLKEAFAAVRERQLRAAESVDDLLADPPAADDPELVAAVVAQNQVTTRLEREVRELCAILEETILDRLDGGPGAEAIVTRRLDDWRATPLDRGGFEPEAWVRLADDYQAGRFGRLDVVGRLLDMADVALELSTVVSPDAHELLVEARNAPDATTLGAGRARQQAVLDGLDRLLDRMDEWEDYQEVLTLVKSLIEDQKSLREASQRALTGREGNN